jgi:DNA repair exonuclease SbcCD ATPase subunit
MKPIEVKIKNLGLIDSLDVKFPSAGLILVQGENMVGKSTFIRGLSTLFSAGIPTNLLKRDEKYGYIEAPFKARNGDEYICRLDLDPNNKTDRLTVLAPDGKKVKKIGDIKDLFAYPQFTIEDFFDKGKTTEGAREQAQIVIQLLPEDVQEKIKSLSEDEKEAYDKRTYLFRLKEDKEGAVKQLKPSIEDVQMVDQLPLLEKEMDAVGVQLQAFNEVGIYEERLTSVANKVNICDEKLKEYGVSYRACDAEIERLKKLITDQEERKNAIALSGNKVKEEKKELEKAKEELEGKLEAFDNTKRKALEKRMEELTKEVKEGYSSKTIVDAYHSALKEWQDVEAEHKVMDERIETIRRNKKNLMTSELPIKNLFIEDDLLYFEDGGELFRFNTNETSQSRLMFKTIEIFMAVNKGVEVVLISRGESLDKNMIKSLHEMGVKNEYLYIMEYVSEGDIQVIAYEDGN